MRVDVKKMEFKTIVSFVVSWTLLLMYLSNRLSGDNLIYAIGELRTYNPSIFSGNVYMDNGVISPRYIVDIIFDAVMHLNGGDWGTAALLWLYFGAFIQSIAIANIAHRMSEEYQIFISAIFTCFIAYCNNFLAGFYLIALESTSVGIAVAFSFLSISFLVGHNRNYNLAWAFAACAIVCHIHEGFYCCAVVFILALSECIINKRFMIRENIAVLIAFIALVSVVGPSMVTDSMEMTNEEFVYIYSILRHPHHLVPSSWGTDCIYKTFWIDFSLFLIPLITVKKEGGGLKKQRIIEASFLIAAWILAISFMYVFTEIKPIAFVSTMFFSKSFKYVLLIGLTWIIEASFEMRKRGRLISHYLLIYYTLSVASYDLSQIGLLAILILVICKMEERYVASNKAIISNNIVTLVDFIFFCFIVCVKREAIGIGFGTILNLIFSPKSTLEGALSGGRSLIVIGSFFAISVITFALKRKFVGYKPLCMLALVWMIGLSLAGRVIIYDDSLHIIKGEDALRYTMGDELYDLATEFKDKTNDKVEFLADPDDTTNTGWFQVVCQRNCFVVYKVIPSSKITLDDWYERYLKVGGFADRTAEEIENVMLENKIEYLMVKSDYYEKIEESQNYSRFLGTESDSFRIYKLN